MLKKTLAILLALCLMAGGLAPAIFAVEGEDDSLILIFEENFEEYEKDVTASSTLMPDFFVCDANSIGDGYIKVQEAANGNLYLKSHVFSQVYSATPIVGAYEFSLDIHEAQGMVQTGAFIRAPKTTAAYYEADGHPNDSVCQAGLFIYPHGSDLGVNVKTYDANAATAHLQNNTVTFPLPSGAAYPYNLRVVDTAEEITLFINDTLICRITFENPGQVYGNHQSEGKFFGSAKLFDAEGNEKGSYENPLLSSDSSYIGWTTRNTDMIVDNITVKAEAAYQALLAINKLPTKVTDKNIEDAKELAAAARELYNALPEDKKALVINYGKLTKAEESITRMESTTEAPTEPVEPPTEDVTEVPTESVEVTSEDVTVVPTEPSETTVETPTEVPTESPAEETTRLADGTDPSEKDAEEGDKVVEIVKDDTLILYILIAVMIVAIGGAAGYITVKVRK